MIRFKNIFLSEATITTGKNPSGTKLMLGEGKSSKIFLDKVKEVQGITYKYKDIFVLSEPVPETMCTDIVLGKNVSDFYIQNLVDGIIYHVMGSPSVLNSIFSYIKGRGKGGKDFEHQFKTDLIAYMSAPEGHTPDNLIHPDVISKVVELFKDKGIDLQSFGVDDFKVTVDGGKNQKRPIEFNGNSLIIKNSNGKTLTDVTLSTNQGMYYFSLKFSDSIYVVNSSVRPFIEKADTHTRAKFYEFFGLDGEQMAGFGEEFFASTKKVSSSKVKKNLLNLITSAFGQSYIMIHKFSKNNVFVQDLETPTTGKITSDLKYSYPDNGKRSYANIQFTCEIHGFKFKANIQFRDTKGGVSKPSYLRFNLVKMK